MAYLRILQKGPRKYYYVLQSYRKEGKVSTKVLEYLGREPEKERLERAFWYWGVKSRKGRDGMRAQGLKPSRRTLSGRIGNR